MVISLFPSVELVQINAGMASARQRWTTCSFADVGLFA